ncbi:MAG: hypothetical protein KKA73_17570 [Chloroflexi bacterium]|nr:hypothetical protein [Chloroflexota bacterium]MBU1749497.1 hypothetical protein [Chloroflexota bacterium]MBU1880113.1 hypothetical protein [Chloroflexota bacterium]
MRNLLLALVIVALLTASCDSGPAPTNTPAEAIPTIQPSALTPTATATPAPTSIPQPVIPTPRPTSAEDVDVLVLVPHYYGANHYLNVDDYEQYGWNVTLAGITQTIQPCPRFGYS